MILSVVFFNLLFRARDKILYKFDNREIGRQFLMFAGEPFFGISLMFADLKVAESSPFRKQIFAYLCSGTRNTFQNLRINSVLSPSIPGADLVLACLEASSSSNSESGISSCAASFLESLLFTTILLASISGPRKFSMQPLRSSGSSVDLVYMH